MLQTTTAAAVVKTYGVVLARRRAVFARLPDIMLQPGRSLALLGPSGSGKTTALMALAGVYPPASGRIEIAETDLWALGAHARDRFRGQRIGLVFQSFHLVDALTVGGNLALASTCAGLPPDRERISRLLQRLDLQSVRDKRADRISHGQAQRVAVLRALVNKPALVLADEPTSALDDENASALLRLLKETSSEAGAALVVASHDKRVIGEVDTVVHIERAS